MHYHELLSSEFAVIDPFTALVVGWHRLHYPASHSTAHSATNAATHAATHAATYAPANASVNTACAFGAS